MAKSRRSESRLPKGVTELARARGGRRYRAAIRVKGVGVHLGLYELPWFAALAFNIASSAIGRGAIPPNEIPQKNSPSSDEVREITSRVKRRLGLEKRGRDLVEGPPSVEALVTFFEVTVLGFWRSQVRLDDGESSVESAAFRIVEAAKLLFWESRPGAPTWMSVLENQIVRRLNGAFRRPEVTREVLDDDRDEPLCLARWLALPDESSSIRGFREEVRYLYADLFPEESQIDSGWADILGIEPPFSTRKVRDAYRRHSKSLHPDAGGSHGEFVRLNAAYEEALAFLVREGESR